MFIKEVTTGLRFVVDPALIKMAVLLQVERHRA
jgi:hypothetical protein